MKPARNIARIERIRCEAARHLRDDDGLGMALKLVGIAVLSLLVFDVTLSALLAFVLGLTTWLLARTVRLVLEQAEQQQELKLYVTRLERRLRDLEFNTLQAADDRRAANERY